MANDQRTTIQKNVMKSEQKLAYKSLLKWYDKNGRELPWRKKEGKADPYEVWLSEIMLQQTTVKAVIPYFEKFLSKWPTIQDLAKAPLDDVLTNWAGLGYYARARNLKKCAEFVYYELGGIFPATESELLKLPGIGPYTAAAIASISFGKKAIVVDGNVERVMSRVFRVNQPLPKSKPILKEKAALLTPEKRSGDYAQALMDLGATICTPKKPDCGNCPWGGLCKSFNKEDVTNFPKREKKTPKPTRYGIAFVIEIGDEIFLQKREEKGLLGGMIEVPSSPWIENNQIDHLSFVPIKGDWLELNGVIKHTFTHFHLRLEVRVLKLKGHKPNMEKGFWAPLNELQSHALPTLMKKVIKFSGLNF